MEQRWIPVSERLPERGLKYHMNLVTVRSGEIMLGVYRWDDKEWRTRPEEGGTYYTTERNVIAWMPLPEPYRGGEPPKQTNADRIRSMTDEDLAIHTMCPNDTGLAEIECDKSDSCNCYECLLNWLRAESEEKHGE